MRCVQYLEHREWEMLPEFRSENLKESVHSGYLGRDEVILEWTLERLGMTVWTGFN
jgi:hypothetical protein